MKHYDILKMKSYYNYFYLNLFEKEIETSWICGNEKFIWFTYMTEKWNVLIFERKWNILIFEKRKWKVDVFEKENDTL